ncbi:MAG: PglZ domain-containing protein [Nitriliruptorales bacterium]|nr:PglZ domain-containing protein [Nitriliruptorales bacterium]
MEPVRPDYGGAWIGGIVPALSHGETPAWLPAPVKEARGILLLVLDGLGWQLVSKHAEHLPTLRAMAGGPITSVVPSTTAAALTSISTGTPPSEHGLVGYRIRVGGESLNVLRWESRAGPDPAVVQPIPPFMGRDVPVVTRTEFRHSGFSEAHLRNSTLIGWRTPSALVEHCRRLATDRHPLVYGYYDGIDKIAHEYGLHNGFLTMELAAADRLVADLLGVLPADWALLVTADHGQVHVEEEDVIGLHAVDGLVAGYSGEGRFRTLHARAGASRELTAACEEIYGGRAWVFTRDRLFDEGWMGQSATFAVRGRVGDVVLAARDDVVFLDPDVPMERMMRSHHGSLTEAEMLVPLLAERG